MPFTEIQEQIRDRCPEELFTIIMRRFMMRIADQLARKQDCGALITGESVGQVASQTVKAIACTDIVTDLPVFRPVIGMDKREILPSPMRSTPLKRQFFRMRTAARCLHPNIPAPGRAWTW